MKKTETLDFDEEGRKLYASLNIDFSQVKSGPYNSLDPIWKHPTTGGTIYVGNQTAASSLDVLRAHNIISVVNCTSGPSQLPNYHDGKMNYYIFPVTYWSQHATETNESILAFSDPLFQFIDRALLQGGSVLVHCLAGAHRAGTTGCACLIHYAGLGASDAIAVAKRCRRIIDPIGMLPEFLTRLHRAEVEAEVERADSDIRYPDSHLTIW